MTTASPASAVGTSDQRKVVITAERKGANVQNPTDQTLELRRRVAVANRVLGYHYNEVGLGMLCMSRGHVSARTSNPAEIFLKGRSLQNDSLIQTSVRDIITVDLEGRKVRGPQDVALTGETKLHTCVLKARPEVGAVCHAHSHNLVLCSLLGLKLKPMCNEGIDLFPVEIYPSNAMISTPEHMAGLVRTLGKNKAAILRGHGAVTVADDCETAVLRMIQLDEQARLNYLAFAAKGPRYRGIPPSQASGLAESIRSSVDRTGAPDAVKKNITSQMNLWEYLAGLVGEIS